VTTSAGTGASPGSYFDFLGVPAVNAFTPIVGVKGDTITLTGTDFVGVTAVTLCNVGTTFTVNSETQISAQVPAGACDGRWRVTTPAGTGASPGAYFDYVDPPTITGFSPGSGAVGATVTLTGTGFSGATAVTLCNVSATFSVISATSITAQVPASACDGRWRVTTAAGVGTSTGAYFDVT
jgi:hypothetical protein